MNELEGICPRCGLGYYGWALNNELNQFCVKCGSALEIKREGVPIRSGASYFEDEKSEPVSDEDRWDDIAR
jgi:hypothetical protein